MLLPLSRERAMPAKSPSRPRNRLLTVLSQADFALLRNMGWTFLGVWLLYGYGFGMKLAGEELRQFMFGKVTRVTVAVWSDDSAIKR